MNRESPIVNLVNRIKGLKLILFNGDYIQIGQIGEMLTFLLCPLYVSHRSIYFAQYACPYGFLKHGSVLRIPGWPVDAKYAVNENRHCVAFRAWNKTSAG